MRRAIVAAAAAAIIGLTSPASAAETVNGGTVSFSGAALPSDIYTVNFTATGFPSITSSLQLTYTGCSGSTCTFDYLLTNNASATTNRISVFGFNVNPNIVSSTFTSTLFNTVSSGQIENQSLEVCYDYNQSNNCNGSTGGVGLFNGQSDAGTITLTFGQTATQVDLSNFLLKYQSIPGPNGTTLSALGTQSAVPEPATWAMMLMGFAGIGTSMRRRRQPRLAQIA
jgi:hypothetical protein